MPMELDETCARDCLRRLSTLAVAMQADDLRAEADATLDRVSAGRFFVACVGQFKRGKSTLVNALVGEPALPFGVLPVTSIITIVRYGSRRAAAVHFQDGTTTTIDVGELAAYVTEAANPGNTRGVSVVDVFLPSPLLASGMCLVDTPGVGSVFEASTEAVRAFVPHIDAALVVLGADPPITGEELRLVEAAAHETGRLVFVLNKADRTSDTERREAAAFTIRLLRERSGIEAENVLSISAADEQRGRHDQYEWTLLVHRLREIQQDIAESDFSRIAARACRRIGGQLRNAVAERLAALRRPLDESEDRIQRIEQASDRIDALLQDLDPLLVTAEQQLSRYFRERQARFAASVRPAGLAVLRSRLAAVPRDQRFRAQALEIARDLARTEVEQWLRSAEPEASTLFRSAVSRLVNATEEGFGRLVAGLPLPSPSVDVEDLVGTLAGRQRFHFTSLMRLTGLDPLAAVWRALRGGRERRVLQEAEVYFVRLLETNASRAATDIVERLRNTRQRLRDVLHDRLTDAATQARSSLDRARVLRAKGEAAAAAELARLDVMSAELERLSALAAL
jgi:GTP-binding protein EngB required for normal cell division